jgi:hypothetical protein
VKDDQVSGHQTNDYKFGSHTPKLSNQNTAYIEYSKCSAWSFYKYTKLQAKMPTMPLLSNVQHWVPWLIWCFKEGSF